MGTLFVVATPIGNLQDLTARALEVLAKVDVVACEDTRNTLKLLTRYNLKKHLMSYYSHREEAATGPLIDLLSAGQDVALVTDSGTPGLSDPGALLVRAAAERGIPIVPIPGPSAFSALLSVSGMAGRGVIFAGFLSPKPGKRKKELQQLLDTGLSLVLYESPFRIVKLLELLCELAPERQCVAGREMTKVHEEFYRGTAQEVLTRINQMTTIKGEFSLLVGGRKNVQVVAESGR
jgi:16S rRNA (cytidine1402-2'-O)-methyltransferase